ncbi:hypothetical protein BC629DRAFT_1216629 [Irpex lacteus]|nr:hypothetical protein BC629DRAFT_1216629 [Irpex lacteus]
MNAFEEGGDDDGVKPTPGPTRKHNCWEKMADDVTKPMAWRSRKYPTTRGRLVSVEWRQQRKNVSHLDRRPFEAGACESLCRMTTHRNRYRYIDPCLTFRPFWTSCGRKKPFYSTKHPQSLKCAALVILPIHLLASVSAITIRQLISRQPTFPVAFWRSTRSRFL